MENSHYRGNHIRTRPNMLKTRATEMRTRYEAKQVSTYPRIVFSEKRKKPKIFLKCSEWDFCFPMGRQIRPVSTSRYLSSESKPVM